MTLPHRLQRVCVKSYLGALALQFYAAGLGVFGAADFMPHALLGYGLIIGAVTLTVLTVTARLPRRAVLLAAGLIPLTILQPVLALTFRAPAPALSALHALNALVIFTFAAAVARFSSPSA
jgi:hypothetical protein